MNDLISRKAVIEELHKQDLEFMQQADLQACIKETVNRMPTAYDAAKEELRLLGNYLRHMPKTYRNRYENYMVVRDLLMANTSHAGQTSCITKCRELGIDPYGYDLEGAVKDE